MNKKQYRERNKKRNQSREETSFQLPSTKSPIFDKSKLESLVQEFQEPAMDLFHFVKEGAERELSKISNQTKSPNKSCPSKLSNFIARLKRKIGFAPEPGVLTRFAFESFYFADKLVDSMGDGNLACRGGCHWCCSEKVALSIPEVFCLANYLNDFLTSESLANLKIEINRTARKVKELSSNERRKAQIFCPLLVNGNCSVYPVRPLTCRGYNSLDDSVCQKIYQNENVLIPYSFNMKEFVFMVFYGIVEGAKNAGLQSDAVELITALDFVLQNPNAEERWLKGETVFPNETISLESYQPIKY